MISTTTCSYSNPLQTGNNGRLGVPTEDNANFNFGSSTCITDTPNISASIVISSSSLPSVYNGFTYGEAVGTFFTSLTFIIISFAIIFFSLRGFKIRQ